MKINVISDIHATYNPKAKEVIYHLPYKYTINKYVTAAEKLYSYWNDNIDKLKNINFKKANIYKSFPEYYIVKNYNTALDVLKEFYDYCKADFEGLTKDKMFYFSRALTNIDIFIHENGIDWREKKTKLDIEYDLKNFMFKHLGDFDPSKLESADYLIIAGDLGLDNIYDLVLKDIEDKTKGKFKKILHIAGNHDHWWHGIQGMNLEKPDHINLEHDYCEHQDGDYLFLGCTLWTPIPDEAIWRIRRGMNDYNYIPGQFSPYTSRHQYEIQSTWLRNKIEYNKDKKVIVFTHHQPFEELIAEDYKHNGKGWDGDCVNEAYCVMDHSLDDINKNGNIKLWCCGHTHQNFDGILHDVHIVRNPIGYGDLYDQYPAENISETWYNKIIEV